MLEHVAHITGWQKFFSDQTNGLRTSNESFLKALLLYSKIKKLDLFLPDPFVQKFKEEWEPFLKDINRLPDVHMHRLWDIPAYVGSNSYDLMVLGDPLINKMAYIRDRIAKKTFSISGITHSLHGFADPTYTLNLLAAKTQPYDSIICTSKAGKKALENSFKAHTQYLENALESPIKEPKCRLDFIPLGVEAPTPTGLTQKEAKRTINVPENDPLILCNGRISILTKMDHAPILIALKNLIKIKGLENTRLLIAGAVDMNSPYLNALAFKITQMGLDKNVLFKLNYHTSIKSHLYEAADVVVSLPDNIQETFGVAPVEAMLLGRPVIVSHWDGHAELLKEGESGYLIPTYSSPANIMTELAMPYCSDQVLLYMSQAIAIDVTILTNRLQSLLLNPELRERLGKNAKAHAKNQFLWENIIPQYDALWEEISQIAEKSPIYSFKKEPQYPTYPNLHTLFGHYASHTINQSDSLTTTPYGQSILNREDTINLYPTVLTWVDADSVFKILKFTQQPKTLSAIIDEMGYDASITTYLILWALKNHLLSIQVSDSL